VTAGVPAPATATVLRWVSKLPENSHGATVRGLCPVGPR